ALGRGMLTRLVTSRGARMCRSEAELTGQETRQKQTLDALVQGRIVVARETEDGTSYELAHEALLQGWSTLRGWLDADAGARALRERLESSSSEWERLGRPRELLWGGRQVAEAAPLIELGPREQAFLAASRKMVRRRRGLGYALMLGLPALAVVAYTSLSFRARRERDRLVRQHWSTAESQVTEARAHAHTAAALRQQAFERFDRRDRQAGEERWASARAAAKDSASEYE